MHPIRKARLTRSLAWLIALGFLIRACVTADGYAMLTALLFWILGFAVGDIFHDEERCEQCTGNGVVLTTDGADRCIYCRGRGYIHQSPQEAS